jgi:hypothetical protein
MGERIHGMRTGFACCFVGGLLPSGFSPDLGHGVLQTPSKVGVRFAMGMVGRFRAFHPSKVVLIHSN